MKVFLPTLLCALIVVGLSACKSQKQENIAPDIDSARICQIQFDADSAFAHIQAQCNFGFRTPNSKAIEQCGDYLVTQFEKAGLNITQQRTVLKGWDGKALRCRNIIASYQPEKTERIILAAHYDTRPWADHAPDSTQHRHPVMGANDGASGIAVLLELARLLPSLKPAVGIDFICFDTEDYGAPYWAPESAQQDPNTWCLGSQYWSRNPHREGYSARYGILLDMVGGAQAQFRYEGYSLQYARPLLMRTWEAARLLGFERYFVTEEGGYVTDDHVPVNEIASIPMIDIVPYHPTGHFCEQWHTTDDVPARIDKKTLKAVGQTVLQFLSEEK